MQTTTAKLGWGLMLGFVTSCALAPKASAAPDLLPPFRVEANGKPVEAEGGNAVPFLMDFDGDGQADLLLGQFKGGRLRIYHNTGSNTKKEFGAWAWFKAGSADGRVPAG